MSDDTATPPQDQGSRNTTSNATQSSADREFPVQTPAHPNNDQTMPPLFRFASPTNAGTSLPVGLPPSELFREGRVVIIERADRTANEGMPFSGGNIPLQQLATVLGSPIHQSGFIALRIWYPARARYDDILLPLGYIAAIRRPTEAEVRKYFSQPCPACKGAKNVDDQPCAECEGTGETIIDKATRQQPQIYGGW